MTNINARMRHLLVLNHPNSTHNQLGPRWQNVGKPLEWQLTGIYSRWRMNSRYIEPYIEIWLTGSNAYESGSIPQNLGLASVLDQGGVTAKPPLAIVGERMKLGALSPRTSTSCASLICMLALNDSHGRPI